MSSTLARDDIGLDALHEAAMAETGLSDFGNTLYLEGLNRLIAEVSDSPRRAKIARRFRNRCAITAVRR